MLRIPTILIGDGEGGDLWDNVRSPFRQMIVTYGFFVITGSPQRYPWSEGVAGGKKKVPVWEEAAEKLKNFQSDNFPARLYKTGRFNVIAYGASANVVAYAICCGLKVHDLITVDVRNRRHMKPVWRAAKPKIIGRWTHIHTGTPYISMAMKLADYNVKERFRRPRNLMDPELWVKRGWAERLTRELDING